MNFEDYNFSLPIQIRWNDLDALGHVNNAIYVTYFEVARGFFMLEACPGWDWKKDMFLIASVNVSYKKELLLTSPNVKVHIKTSHLGGKSFELSYAITSQKGDDYTIHAEGKTTQVMFDLKERKSMNIPDWVRTALASYDNL